MAGTIYAMTVPKLGMTMKEGTVAVWHMAPGGEVKQGQPVFDIETEKITTECEAPAPGILRRQVATAGQKLPVGALVGVIAAAEVSDADIDKFVAGFKPEQEV